MTATASPSPELRSLTWRFVGLSWLTWLPSGLTMVAFVLLPQARGLSLNAVGLLFVAYGVVTLVLELPTGGLADALGRRPVLLASAVLRTASLALLALAPSFGLLALALALAAVGRALGSGPLEAWYVDAALRLDVAADLQRGIARGRSAEAAGLAVGAVGGGLLPLLVTALPSAGSAPLLRLSLPCLAGAVVSALSLVAFALVVREERTVHERSAWRSAWLSAPVAVRDGVGTASRDAVLRRILVSTALLGVTLVTAELLTPTQLARTLGSAEEGAAAYGGLATAGFAGTAAGAALAPAVARLARSAPRAAALLLVLAAGGMAALAGPVVALGLAGYLVLYLCLGGSDALMAEVVHRRVRSGQRTTVLSAQSLVGQLGGVGGNLAVPALAAASGLPAGWLLGAAATLLAGLVLLRLPVARPAPALLAVPVEPVTTGTPKA